MRSPTTYRRGLSVPFRAQPHASFSRRKRSNLGCCVTTTSQTARRGGDERSRSERLGGSCSSFRPTSSRGLHQQPTAGPEQSLHQNDRQSIDVPVVGTVQVAEVYTGSRSRPRRYGLRSAPSATSLRAVLDAHEPIVLVHAATLGTSSGVGSASGSDRRSKRSRPRWLRPPPPCTRPETPCAVPSSRTSRAPTCRR